MTKIIQRHDTAANWTSVNPVLAAGEMGVETDTNKFKFGDGVTAWSGLAYAAGEGGGSSGTTLTSTDGTTTYNKLALGETLSVKDTSTKELNKLTQTGGTLNSELEFTGASGASLKMTEKYSLSTADSWEFQIKYKHNGGGNFPTIFGYASGSDCKTPVLLYQDGTLVLYLSSNGGSWDLNLSGSGLSLVSGTIYYFKVGFTGSQYYIKYNTTGWSDEFTTQWTLNSTTKVYCSDYFMLMNLSLNSDYYNTGTMYLQDTALLINGAEVWRGANIIPGDMILNTSYNAYTKTETDSLLSTKQDKLTAISPVKIGTQTFDGVVGYDVNTNGTLSITNGNEAYFTINDVSGKLTTYEKMHCVILPLEDSYIYMLPDVEGPSKLYNIPVFLKKINKIYYPVATVANDGGYGAIVFFDDETDFFSNHTFTATKSVRLSVIRDRAIMTSNGYYQITQLVRSSGFITTSYPYVTYSKDVKRFGTNITDTDLQNRLNI